MPGIKKTVFFIAFLLPFSLSNATVRWASQVIGYSSQYSTKQYSAAQALGKPNVIPGSVITPCAWRPLFRNDSSSEWIEVAFPEPMHITRVAVSENNIGGGISMVYLRDSAGNYHKVYSSAVELKRPKGTMLNVSFLQTDYKVHSVKLMLNYTNPDYKYQIDAIAVSDDDIPLKASVNLASNTVFESKPENLGDSINSRYSELLPIISPQGDVLYFTRSDHPANIGLEHKMDVWYSKIDSAGRFEKAVNIGPPINNEFNNFAFSITQDGNGLLLGNRYFANGKMTKGASVSYKTKDGWSLPDSIRIEGFVNLNSDAGYFLASSGKEMILAVEMEDSRGGTDLYASHLQENGYWSKPVNLGDSVNTSSNETTPFLASDGKTLYYSTSGRCGFGDYDIFITRRLDDSWSSWEEPGNMGNIINTPAWEGYFTIPASGNYAYYSSSYRSAGNEDIIRILLPAEYKPKSVVLVKGRVINNKTGEPIDARIIYELLPLGTEAGVAKPNPLTGEYSIVLPAGNKYGFLAQADGFIPINENLDLRNISQYSELNRDLKLVPMEVGQVIRLNNIFFEFGKYSLLEDSYSELNRVGKMLADHPGIKIEISGHTDDVGPPQANSTLSVNRAKAVADYLTEKGTAKSRLIVKGYGHKKPLAPNDTDENRQLNRRVEFKIVKE